MEVITFIATVAPAWFGPSTPPLRTLAGITVPARGSNSWEESPETKAHYVIDGLVADGDMVAVSWAPQPKRVTNGPFGR
jgi:hypothetical protein